MCRLRLTLGFVKKSAVSGNSTGGRVTRDDVEAAPNGRGLCMGEVTGLRLGDVPARVRGQRSEGLVTGQCGEEGWRWQLK